MEVDDGCLSVPADTETYPNQGRKLLDIVHSCSIRFVWPNLSNKGSQASLPAGTALVHSLLWCSILIADVKARSVKVWEIAVGR